MSYLGISVREAMSKLNATHGGWFLPQVQRQYVWGARHESEGYVCLLLDSLKRGYPIGGVVLWETSTPVPYREFVRDYAPGQYAHQVEEGRWGAAKSLVYDGQQRLQTLYSVLYYRLNGRVLHFDMLFDADAVESDDTGFLFRDADAAAEVRYLKMTELVSKVHSHKEKVVLEERLLAAANGDAAKQMLVRVNLTALWDIFVADSTKSIAYFSVRAETPTEVNEVFRRLNTGGVALTQLELVLSKIKAVQSDYEEELWRLSETIREVSGGIAFSSTEILQFFHLMVKKTARIDADRLEAKDIAAFQKALADDSDALVEVFQGYLAGLFSINHASIVPRWLAVLPIASFLAARKRGGHEWRIRALPVAEVTLIHRYFLLSQFCDWNTQTMVNQFARAARDDGEAGLPFPLDAIRQTAIQKSRTGDLHEHQFLAEPWLAAKVLMPSRSYIFHERKPQVDHIFPLNLKGADETYQNAVDVLWNFQPMPAEVNNYKRAKHPKEFFCSEEGRKYIDAYDFIPDTSSLLWDDYVGFIAERERKMRGQLETKYGVRLITNPQAEV
ncbi:DUF262 domain-containing protein [Paraburkholderia denitrificans]|uniref:DUF262 domain-containing protein n=1 Tax=Paraburkholderia denitrificans TaxID=694025 RepID=A0ABW0JDE8_9BURK